MVHFVSMPDSDAIPFREARFNTTHWSVVLTAGHFSNPGASAALEELCQAYWFPLYGFVRRQGYCPTDAEDLTQGFFAWLLQSEHLGVADPERGRFRSFLLCRLKHFLSDACKKARSQKRGGGQTHISLDAVWAEEHYGLEPSTELSPDVIFDRRWALTVLEQTVERLRLEYVKAERGDWFEELRHFQPGEEATRSYAEVAARLGVSEGAVKSAVYRLRQRHGDLLREAITQTVINRAQVDEEIRYPLSILSKSP